MKIFKQLKTQDRTEFYDTVAEEVYTKGICLVKRTPGYDPNIEANCLVSALRVRGVNSRMHYNHKRDTIELQITTFQRRLTPKELTHEAPADAPRQRNRGESSPS